jgi:hypothetical protein
VRDKRGLEEDEERERERKGAAWKKMKREEERQAYVWREKGGLTTLTLLLGN